MIRIHTMLSPRSILIHPQSEDKEALIKEIILSLEASGLSIDKGLLFKDVMDRENLSSTGLENGCAIPHAHSMALEKTVIAAAVLQNGIDFSAADGTPARIIFFIAGPKTNAAQHLKLISKLARILNDTDFREALVKAVTPEDFLELIKKREE